MAKKYVKISTSELEKIQKLLSKADYIAEKFLFCDEARDVLIEVITDASNALYKATNNK